MTASSSPPTGLPRLGQALARLKREGRAGLAAFVTAGDPDLERSQRVLEGLAGAGADIIELGMPFSDPSADGPAIQAGSMRALKAGMTVEKTLDMVRRFRRRDAVTPLVLMGYANPVFNYGPDRFAAAAAAAAVDGLIIVDTPHEERNLILEPARKRGIAPIVLVSPTADDERLKTILNDAEGFIYYVSITGVTGSALQSPERMARDLKRIRSLSDLPIAVGFGIRTPEDAARIGAVADLAAVGSAIVERIAAAAQRNDARREDDPGREPFAFIRSLADALKMSRS